MAPVARLEKRRALDGPPGEDVHDAAECPVAPHARPPAMDDLDLLDGLERDAVPVHPAPERVVDRDTVEQHEGAARTARADAAERQALRCGVTDDARRAPEQAEAGHLAEEIVHGLARGLAHVLAGDDRHAGGCVARLLLEPCRRDDHGLEWGGGRALLRRGRRRDQEEGERHDRREHGHSRLSAHLPGTSTTLSTARAPRWAGANVLVLAASAAAWP